MVVPQPSLTDWSEHAALPRLDSVLFLQHGTETKQNRPGPQRTLPINQVCVNMLTMWGCGHMRGCGHMCLSVCHLLFYVEGVVEGGEGGVVEGEGVSL